MKMTVLETFRKIAREPFNEHLRKHKQEGGRIMGIFCSYVPEELIIAAGMVPFRMRAVGSTKTTLGDTWFSSFNCSYVRHLFDLALEGSFEFLDGLVFINACDHIRRMFDNWKAAVDHPAFVHMTAVPHKRAGHAIKWYREELEILKRAMEDHFKIKITDHAIREAIRNSNQVQRLLTSLYELRKEDQPPITGAEILSVIMAGTALPQEQFINYLDQLLEELPGREVYPPDVPRLMIQSGCMEEIEHIEMIEGLGCAVVDDSMCFGRRYFDRDVDESLEDPLQALAERYMLHLSCPRISDDFRTRLEHTRQSVKDYRLDGLICEKLKFCDLWGGEAFILRQESRNSGLPVLALERELYGGGEGQIKTRVQAFLERIGKI
jgi:benzoyl-CoA reductase subunit C